MKRYIVLLGIIIYMLCMCGCNKNKEEELLHLGLNARIIEIDLAEQVIYVSEIPEDNEKIFGGRSALDCSKAIEREKIIYVNYKDENDVRIISFEDLIVGDDIILNIYDKELKDVDDFILVEQIQLATQRMD